MARACRDVYVPARGCLQSYAELFDSSQHRLASVYLSQFPTGFLHIIRAARIWEGNSSILNLNCNINKHDKSRRYSKNTENDWLNHRTQTLNASFFGVPLCFFHRDIEDQWPHDGITLFWSHLCFINYGKLINSVWVWTWLKLCVAINNVLIANVYCWIWRRCWSWLIFRQGSGLFCRAGPRGCVLFFTSVLNVNRKCVQLWMYTHASTNKHHDTLSTLNREMEKAQRQKGGNIKQAPSGHTDVAGKFLFFSASVVMWQPAFVCLFVCLSAKWLKKLQIDLNEIFWKCW